MKKGKRRKTDRENKFHIYAKRRFPQLRDDPENISIVNIQKHEEYHKLFGLQTPPEVVAYLNNYFWRGMYTVILIRRKDGKEIML